MNVQKWMSVLAFIFFCNVPVLRGMDAIKYGTSATCAVSGIGLIAYAIQGHKSFIDKSRFKKEPVDPEQTLFVDEWVKEVLLPLSGGTLLMLAGFMFLSC
jgi:hypothetical protein